MGYASRAIKLLVDYYQGLAAGLDDPVSQNKRKKHNEADSHGDLLSETIAPRTGLPPLLQVTTQMDEGS